jgi:predicted transcriptional regulator
LNISYLIASGVNDINQLVDYTKFSQKYTQEILLSLVQRRLIAESASKHGEQRYLNTKKGEEILKSLLLFEKAKQKMIFR